MCSTMFSLWVKVPIPWLMQSFWVVGRAADATGSYPVLEGFNSLATHQNRLPWSLSYIKMAHHFTAVVARAYSGIMTL